MPDGFEPCERVAPGLLRLRLIALATPRHSRVMPIWPEITNLRPGPSVSTIWT
jgi:hypothetical protein